MSVLLLSILIFCCRIVEISIDTLRVVNLIKGRIWIAATMAFIQGIIFLTVLSNVLTPPIHWVQVIAYASGFAVGTMIGVKLSDRISSNYVLMRVFELKGLVLPNLRQAGYLVTHVQGEGRDGKVSVLYCVIKKREADRVLAVVKEADAKAFVIFEPIDRAMGGYVPRSPHST